MEKKMKAGASRAAGLSQHGILPRSRWSWLGNVAACAVSVFLCSCGTSDRESTDLIGTSTVALDAPSEEIQEAMFDDGSGMVAYSTPLTREVGAASLDDSQAEWHVESAFPSRTSTEVVLSLAASRSSQENMEFSIELVDVPFDFSGLALDSDQNRAKRIATRKMEIQPGQDAVARAVGILGGTVISRYWLANALHVIAPASVVEKIISLPSVTSASPAVESIVPGAAYDGDTVRNGTLAANLLALGYDANAGSRSGGPVRIAIIESGEVNASHVGWQDCVGCSSNLRAYYNCTSTGCVQQTPPTPASGDIHGTVVASSAAGSIEQGQDSNFSGSGTFAQRQRSGVAKEAFVYYYKKAGNAGYPKALEHAVSNGIDVVNLSQGITCSGFSACDPAYDCASINATQKAAVDAGIVINACAGNCPAGANCSDCGLWYPGFRTETNACAGLNSSDTATAYQDLTILASAEPGPLPIKTRAGINSTTPGVELAAPGTVTLRFGQGTNNYSGQVGGCSIATPIVSGATALLRQAFADIGWIAASNARAMNVNLAMMGDASNGSVNGESNIAVHPRTGYGRLRAHLPISSDLTAPWAMGWRSFVIKAGETVRWPVGPSNPEPAGITEWKWAFMWYEDNLNSTSNIVIYVRDACNGDQLVASSTSYALRKRIHLNGGISGKCLVMEAAAYDTPSGGTRVWSADYYHGGNTNLH